MQLDIDDDPDDDYEWDDDPDIDDIIDMYDDDGNDDESEFASLSAVTFGRGGSMKAAPKATAHPTGKPGDANPHAPVKAKGAIQASKPGGCGTGAGGFQKNNTCGHANLRNAHVQSARSAHTEARRSAAKHVKAGTLLSKEGREALKHAANKSREFHAAREKHRAEKRDARNAAARERRQAAKAAKNPPVKAEPRKITLKSKTPQQKSDTASAHREIQAREHANRARVEGGNTEADHAGRLRADARVKAEVEINDRYKRVPVGEKSTVVEKAKERAKEIVNGPSLREQAESHRVTKGLREDRVRDATRKAQRISDRHNDEVNRLGSVISKTNRWQGLTKKAAKEAEIAKPEFDRFVSRREITDKRLDRLRAERKPPEDYIPPTPHGTNPVATAKQQVAKITTPAKPVMPAKRDLEARHERAGRLAEKTRLLGEKLQKAQELGHAPSPRLKQLHARMTKLHEAAREARPEKIGKGAGMPEHHANWTEDYFDKRTPATTAMPSISEKADFDRTDRLNRIARAKAKERAAEINGLPKKIKALTPANVHAVLRKAGHNPSGGTKAGAVGYKSITAGYDLTKVTRPHPEILIGHSHGNQGIGKVEDKSEMIAKYRKAIEDSGLNAHIEMYGKDMMAIREGHRPTK